MSWEGWAVFRFRLEPQTSIDHWFERNSSKTTIGRAPSIPKVRSVETGGDEIRVTANARVFEPNLRAETVWRAANQLACAWPAKKVVLVNTDKALYTLSFLI